MNPNKEISSASLNELKEFVQQFAPVIPEEKQLIIYDERATHLLRAKGPNPFNPHNIYADNAAYIRNYICLCRSYLRDAPD